MGIQMGSILKVADNSGAFLVRCIQVLRKTGKCSNGRVGDRIKVSVIQKKKGDSKIKKGDVYKALIIATRENTRRDDGTCISFIDGDGKRRKKNKNSKKVHCNRVVLLNANDQPIATRLFGPFLLDLKSDSKNVKILSMAPEVI